MSFDLSTARPVSGGFDLNTARPEQSQTEQPIDRKFDPMTDVSVFGITGEDVAGTANLAQNIATGIVARPIAGGIAMGDVLQGEGVQGAKTVQRVMSELQTPLSESGEKVAKDIGSLISSIQDNPAFAKVGEILKDAQQSILKGVDKSIEGISNLSGLDPQQIQTAQNVSKAVIGALPETALEVAPFIKGAPISKATRNIIKNSKAGIGIKSALADAAPSVEMLKGASREIYSKLDDVGVLIKPKAYNGLVNNISSSIRRMGFNRKIQPKVQGVLDELESLKGQPLKVTELEVMRRVAQGAASSLEKSEQAMGLSVIEKIDDFLSGLSSSQAIGVNAKNVGTMLKDARSLWGRARKSELITQALADAELQASGLENGIRVQFRQLLKSKKKMKGFSAEEIKAMRKVVQGGKGVNTLKALGGFSLNEGQRTNLLRSALGAGAGASALGAGGLVVLPTIGAVSIRLAEKITSGSANYADDLIRAGKNGNNIVKAYIKNTPKAQRNVGDLTQLLIKGDVNLSKISQSNPVISDSVYLAQNFTPQQILSALGLTAKETIQEGEQ